MTDPAHPGGTGAAGVGIRCGTGVSLGGSGHYGFLLVRSAGKIPKALGKKCPKPLDVQKALRKKFATQNGDSTKLDKMSIVGVVTQNTFTPQPGLDSEAASCLARDTSTAGLMLWLVLSL